MPSWLKTVTLVAISIALLSQPWLPAFVSDNTSGWVALILVMAVFWRAEHDPGGYERYGFGASVSWQTSLRAVAVESTWALAITLPLLFAYGEALRFGFGLKNPFREPSAFTPMNLSMWMAQLWLVGWPEELFFRGYLQSAIEHEQKDRHTITLLGARFSWVAWVAQAVIFALMHLLSEHQVYRLAVFFPGLLFGWMRAKRNGITASIVCHALCNVFGAHVR